MHNKKFLVGALAAIAIAITGIVYSGVGTGQPASVGNLLARNTAPKVVKPVYDNSVYVGDRKATTDVVKPIYDNGVYTNQKQASGDPLTPVYDNGVYTIDKTIITPSDNTLGLDKEVKTFQDSISALEKKIQSTVSPADLKRKLILFGNGWCANTGPFGGTAHIFYCGL